MESDNLLLERVKRGDQIAFRKIFDRYKQRIYAFASRYLERHDDRMDAVQLTFVKLWETRDRIRLDLSFSNYLFTIVKNSIFHDKQKQVNHRAYLDYFKEHNKNIGFSTEETVLFNEANDKLTKAIDHLPMQRQKIFVMRWKRGLSYKEIAEQLELSVKTVETHLRLATRQLREEMSDFYDN